MGEAKRRAAGRAGASAAKPSQYPGEDWNAQATPPIVPGKSCGSCTKCCTVLAIPEVEKPAWQDCRHVAAGRGRTIYPDRRSAGPGRKVNLMEKGNTWFVTEEAVVPVDTG